MQCSCDLIVHRFVEAVCLSRKGRTQPFISPWSGFCKVFLGVRAYYERNCIGHSVLFLLVYSLNVKHARLGLVRNIRHLVPASLGCRPARVMDIV